MATAFDHEELYEPEDNSLDLQMFVAFLREEETKTQDDWLDQDRANAIDCYNGEPYGDEEDGRSQIVTRDVAEVIDYMTVSLLRTMVSGEDVVEFEHMDKRSAEEAGALMMREFNRGQPGYFVLHDWIKAGLLEKTGVAKCCVEEQQPKRVEEQMPTEGLTLLQQQGVQIVGSEPIDDENFNVAYLMPKPPKFRDYVVPNEEVRFAADARELDEDCVYVGYGRERSLSELAKMGFDVDDIADESQSTRNDPLSLSRNTNANQTFSNNRSGPNKTVWHIEEYSLFDLNGDGIAERILSHRVGNQILRRDDGSYAIEEVDEQPGVVWCPFPMQHRIVGQSLADKTMDIQRSRSVLMRQAFDNMYQANAPRVLVNEDSIGDSTVDDLLTVRPAGIVRWKGSNRPEPFAVPFVAGEAFTAMEILSGEKESRTGITRLNQGLDADTLNKTATGTALMQAQGQQIEEYLARNFAEAFARLLLKKYRLMRKFGQPVQIMIDGEARMVDPSKWPEDMDVVARVGLGSGRKDQRLQYRMTALELMKACVEGGLRIVGEEQIYNMMKGVITDANLGSVRDYLVDPSTLGPAEPKPDPAMAKAQADSMISAQKVQHDQENAQAGFMMQQQQMQIDAQLKQQQLEHDLQAKTQKAALDEQLARDKAVFEANLATQQADREYQLSIMQAERQHELAKMNVTLKANRPGGDLSK